MAWKKLDHWESGMSVQGEIYKSYEDASRMSNNNMYNSHLQAQQLQIIEQRRLSPRSWDANVAKEQAGKWLPEL